MVASMVDPCQFGSRHTAWIMTQFVRRRNHTHTTPTVVRIKTTSETHSRAQNIDNIECSRAFNDTY